MDRAEVDTTIRSLIEPFNKKEIDISYATTFANDLEFDSLTVMDFVAAIEDPGNFRKSRSVGAWVGLTTRRYQSGEVDYDGHISRRGDKQLRWLLYEAASTILTRVTAESSLRFWGLGLRERIGFKRAAVAVARKLAVIMHAMLKSGQVFDPKMGTTN